MSATSEHDRTVIDQHTRQAASYADLTRRSSGNAATDPVAASRATAGDRVLDVACGPGSLTLQFAPHVLHATGIDITPAMLEQARAAQQRTEAANVDWREGDAAALPFADDAFDIVASRAAFHHFSSSAQVMAEMVRVCRPGGRMMVIDITPDEGKSAAYDRMERLRDPSHGHAHSIVELSRMAAALGLGQPQVATRMSGPMSYAAVLETSFPEACTRAQLLDMMGRDADGGRDELGFRAGRDGALVMVTYPMSTLVWTRG